MVFSVKGWDEPKTALWLATWAGKKVLHLACPLGTTHCVPQENFRDSHTINSLMTKLVWSRWLDIDLALLLQVYGSWPCLGLLMHKKWPISDHLDFKPCQYTIYIAIKIWRVIQIQDMVKLRSTKQVLVFWGGDWQVKLSRFLHDL